MPNCTTTVHNAELHNHNVWLHNRNAELYNHNNELYNSSIELHNHYQLYSCNTELHNHNNKLLELLRKVCGTSYVYGGQWNQPWVYLINFDYLLWYCLPIELVLLL